MMKIYIDADGCPVKAETYKVANRYKIKVVVVANKSLTIPHDADIQMEVVSGGFDAADDWIVANAAEDDIAITADILLADRLLKKKVRVLGPKGKEFDEDSIGSAVAQRELMANLRHMGEMRGGPSAMQPQDKSKFLATLDQIIQSLRRKHRV